MNNDRMIEFFEVSERLRTLSQVAIIMNNRSIENLERIAGMRRKTTEDCRRYSIECKKQEEIYFLRAELQKMIDETEKRREKLMNERDSDE